MAELDALAGKSDAACSGRDPRALHRSRTWRHGPMIKELVRRGRPVGPRRPDRQHLRALGRARPELARRRDRLAHRRDPALRPVRRHGRSARRARGDPHLATRRVPAGAADRALDVHQRGADAVRHRLPGQPGALREPCRPGRWRRCATRRARRFDEVRRAAGFQGELSKVRLPDGYFAAFVELHIEQGPLLERAGVPIGIVTAIAAPAALRVTWKGKAATPARS